MYCPKCGNKLNGEEESCTKCGNNILKIKEQIISVNNASDNYSSAQQISSNQGNTTAQALSDKSKNIINPLSRIIKSFIKNNKKQCTILLCSFVILIVGIILYSVFFGFNNLSWNKDYFDIEHKEVTQTTLKLGVNFSDEENVDKIKFSSNCGKISSNKLIVSWDLTGAKGKCKISAYYKFKRISKEFTVIPFNNNEHDLYLDEDKIDVESNKDLDLDKLTNRQEKKYKTNPKVADTDIDGFDDYFEIFTSKTDPNKKDTDGDGLSDYDEVKLGLEPLKADSKGDGLKDGNRELTYDYNTNNIKIKITGKGNIASTVASSLPNTKVSGKKGLIDKLFTFNTEGTITKAVVTIPYTDKELQQYKLNEDNLSLYYYNENKSEYEKVDTSIDKTNKTLSAVLTHFSEYVIGDKTVVKQKEDTEILFILDNSWSMYTNEQYKKITGKEYTTGFFGLYSGKLEGSDANGVRFTLTSDLIKKLAKKDYKIGLSEFKNDYKNALKIGSDIKEIQEKLKNMNGKFITSNEGTNITNALNNGVREFSDNSDNKYIVILTDGQDSALNSQSSLITQKATQNNVKICSVGFGDGASNSNLANISNSTGCKFFSSGDADGLEKLFGNLEAELDNNLIDVDNDGKTDGIIIADSGFDANKDGFSFGNYSSNLSNGGHCYGMATFAELYYKKRLPTSLESKTVQSKSSYAYNLNGTYFTSGKNLYDYKLRTNELKYIFGYEYFGETIPPDFRVLQQEQYLINPKYKTDIENYGIYDLEKTETKLDSETQMKRYGFTYKEAENILLNENKIQTSNIIKNDDKQLFNAIYASFIRQRAITNYSSSSNFLVWVRNILGSESTSYEGMDGFINILKTRLDDKDAPVISSNYDGGLHAINAISLVQDTNNFNIYHIGVYDNNYPGEKRYVDIECNNNMCVTKANDYYSKSGEPIRISPSLEADLEFFNN